MTAASSASAGRRPLAWRLGLVLGVTVVAVLLLVGIVVNRVVRNGFETVLTSQQQQRLDDAAVTLADRLSRPLGAARAQALVVRLATSLGGDVHVTATDGTTLAAFGRTPDRDTVHYAVPIEVDGRAVATLEANLPALAGDRGFLPLFNATLALAGVVSVIAIVLISASIAGRLTRPLHDVAAAARRLEAGESGARAAGGDDLETQLQAMIDGVVPADAAGLEAARSAASALGGVVADIDDLARAEAAPLQARPTTVDLAVAIPEIVLGLDGPRRERAAHIDISVQPATVAWADPGHLARALRNVLANGLAHSPTGGGITVTAGHDAALVRIRVADQGPGIAADDVAHVFERFYRADTARATDPATGRSAGLGLGLTIARELLSANGGRIGVERTGPAGTTFLIEVPAAARA